VRIAAVRQATEEKARSIFIKVMSGELKKEEKKKKKADKLTKSGCGI
jgi:hypothetical protein